MYKLHFLLYPYYMESSILKELIVNAEVYEVWDAWTTEAGIKTFFAPDGKVELKESGKYEIYFLPPEKEGARGSEDCHIICFTPKKMLSFSWSAPPEYPEIRRQRTTVVVWLEHIDDYKTLVKIEHTGWKESEQWNAVYDYFQKAWDVVLSRLQKRFIDGPIIWNEQ